MKKKYTIYLLLLFLFLIASLSSATLFLNQLKNANIKTYKEEKVDELNSQYQLVIASRIKMAQALYATLIDRQEVIQTFAQAKGAAPKLQDTVRQNLYNLLKDDYYLLRDSIGLRQLHFHKPNNDSFLRFHRPERYGDNLTDIRESVRLANKNKEFVQGFEEGRIFNGFRYVFPIFDSGEHIGSVEMSISFTVLKELLDSIFNAHYDFIIRGDIVDEKVFTQEQGNYEKTPFYPNYVKETQSVASINANYQKIQKQVKENILNALHKQITTNLPKQNSFVLHHYCEKNVSHCIVTFLSIENLKGEHVAYLISIENDDAIYRFIDQFRQQVITLFAIFLILPLLTYLFFLIRQRDDSEKKASTDFLTGALNRFGCQDSFTLLYDSFVQSGKPFTILMFDIDHFKKINDTHGHDVGDTVLQELVELIKRHIREDDTICRWGGEEFLILVPKTDFVNAQKIAQKLLQLVRDKNFTTVQDLTISIGFTQIKRNDTMDSAIKRADDSLYEAKDSGRDRAIGKK